MTEERVYKTTPAARARFRRYYQRNRAEKIAYARERRSHSNKRDDISVKDNSQEYDAYHEAASWQETRNRTEAQRPDPRLIAPPRVPLEPAKPMIIGMIKPNMELYMKPADKDPRMTGAARTGEKAVGTLVDNGVSIGRKPM